MKNNFNRAITSTPAMVLGLLIMFALGLLCILSALGIDILNKATW